ncbi:hypothetical protein SLS62_007507 [Diatrype stigma]|uniref:Kinesin light chain n=1 Tax=Diatrype stigma TaxID=117547 RepID=A0AAN9YNB5_9PEZI
MAHVDAVIRKTHVTVEYAHKFYEDIPGSSVYWVNAGSAAQFELSYRHIAKNLHIDMKGLGDRSVVETVFHALRQDNSGYWIMIVDGMDDSDNLVATEPAIAGRRLLDFVPKTPFARILATTRSQDLAMQMVNQNNTHIIEVPALNDDDASLILLGKPTSDKAKRKAAVTIANHLGNSAGAIIMVHLFHKSAMKSGLRAYMETISKPKATLKPDQMTMHAWTLLYEKVKKEQDADAHLLCLMGSIEVQCIPSSFFKRSELFDQLPRLVKSGMVEPSSDNRVHTITTTIRRCIHKKLEKSKERNMIEVQALHIMCERFAETEEDKSDLIPCALAVLRFQPTSKEARKNLATLEHRVGSYYDSQGYYREALNHFKECLKLCEGGPGEHRDLAEQAKKAIEKTNSQMALSSKTRSAMKKPADHQTEKGKIDFKQLAKGDWKDRPDMVEQASNFANSQLLQGGKEGPQEALQLYQRVLDWCKEKYGETDIDTGRRQYNLALAHEEVGEYDKAATLYQSAAQIFEQHLGADHPELLRILAALACLFCRQGRLEEAQSVFNVVLPVQQRVLGLDHPETLVTRQNIAMMLESMGKVEAAGDELEEVLAVQARLLGCDDPAVLRTYCSLAMNYRLRGRFEEAEKLFAETLRTQKKLLGENHRDTLMTKLMRKEFQHQAGKKSRAPALDKQKRGLPVVS